MINHTKTWKDHHSKNQETEPETTDKTQRYLGASSALWIFLIIGIFSFLFHK